MHRFATARHFLAVALAAIVALGPSVAAASQTSVEKRMIANEARLTDLCGRALNLQKSALELERQYKSRDAHNLYDASEDVMGYSSQTYAYNAIVSSIKTKSDRDRVIRLVKNEIAWLNIRLSDDRVVVESLVTEGSTSKIRETALKLRDLIDALISTLKTLKFY